MLLVFGTKNLGCFFWVDIIVLSFSMIAKVRYGLGFPGYHNKNKTLLSLSSTTPALWLLIVHWIKKLWLIVFQIEKPTLQICTYSTENTNKKFLLKKMSVRFTFTRFDCQMEHGRQNVKSVWRRVVVLEQIWTFDPWWQISC